MRLGRATHALILEPLTFTERWSVWTGGRRAGKEWDAFVDGLGRREQLSQSEYSEVVAMAVAVEEYEPARNLLRGGRAEVELAWTCDGVTCAGRADYIGPAGVVDLKTCRDASPRAFGAEAHRMLYHAQLSWYAHGAHSPDAPLSIIAVEKESKIVSVYTIDDETRVLAESEWREALRRYRECEQDCRWPAYQVEPTPLQLPRWAWPSEDESISLMELESM